jgi:hypothetical protein
VHTALNQQQVLSFIGWSESKLRSQGPKGVITKLEKMGCTNINIEGRGKKATFTFNVADNFWMMMMVNAEYSPINIDIMQSLVDGNVIYVGNEPLHLLGTEIAAKIAEKHNVELDTVKKAMSRMKTHLRQHGMMMDNERLLKSHRIMNCHREWIIGNRAIVISREIKYYWKLTYKQIRDAELNGKPMSARNKSFMKRQMFDFLIRYYNADSYRVVKHEQVDYRVRNDITWAERAFIAGMNLSSIKEEIASRKAKYKAEWDEFKAKEEVRREGSEAELMALLFGEDEEEFNDIKKDDTVAAVSSSSTKLKTQEQYNPSSLEIQVETISNPDIHLMDASWIDSIDIDILPW